MCMHIYVCVCIYICECICIYMHMCVYVCLCMYVYIHVYVCVYIYLPLYRSLYIYLYFVKCTVHICHCFIVTCIPCHNSAFLWMSTVDTIKELNWIELIGPWENWMEFLIYMWFSHYVIHWLTRRSLWKAPGGGLSSTKCRSTPAELIQEPIARTHGCVRNDSETHETVLLDCTSAIQ